MSAPICTQRGNRNRSYQKLEVWQLATQLFALVWQIVAKECRVDLKLRSQIVDAAQSVAANIAEGYSRQSVNEYLQFLYIALGSLSETLTRAIGLKVAEIISPAQIERIDSLHYELENKLSRLIVTVEGRRNSADWSGRLAEAPHHPEIPFAPARLAEDPHPTDGAVQPTIHPPIQ